MLKILNENWRFSNNVYIYIHAPIRYPALRTKIYVEFPKRIDS